MSDPEFLTRENLITFLQDSRVRVDDFVMAALDIAVEVHGQVRREDKKSPFLETHIWPVAKNVVNHYLGVKRNITSVEVASAILHDIMEDNEKILDLYRTKDYGFDAYLRYRFGNRIYNMCIDLKIKPLENFPGKTNDDRQLARFHDHCKILSSADYDVKAIKLADRINNMDYVSIMNSQKDVVITAKTKRYLREAEDFYLAYALLAPRMVDFYESLRSSYEKLKGLDN
ncbi:MAG: HD domain-containing protein [Thermoproteota archaeon]|jgi:(p)ppGpp synthase/HD superfamily hydrolase|nr:HD domain-containing protein [Thermoproteota archaeon]